MKSLSKRAKTPTVIQMEAVECGAAALGMILGYYGHFVPLEKLRVECGVSRDGSRANNIVKVARNYGLEAKGFKFDVQNLKTLPPPFIVFWNFNHFMVVEGFDRGRVYLNDPASGPTTISEEEFDLAFTGVVLTFKPTDAFQKADEKPSMIRVLNQRLRHSRAGLLFVVLVSLLLIVPGFTLPAYGRIFVDDILIGGRQWMSPLLLGLGGTALLTMILTWFQQKYLLRLETRLALTTSSHFFWHVLRLPIDFFMQRYAGEIGSRVAINDRIATLLSGELATALLSLILVGFYGLLMLQYDVLLTVIGVGIALLNLGALRYFSQKRIDANRRLQREKGTIAGISMNGLQIIETLKATGAESDFFARWSGYYAKAVTAEQQLGVYTKLLALIPPLLTSLNVAIILVIGGLRVVNGDLSIGMLVAFQVLMGSFLMPINQLVNLGSRLQEVEADINRLDDVMRFEEAEIFQQSPVATLPAAQLAGYVELKNITFGYSKLDKPLIEDFSLSLEPGKRVALVGGTGSGKSTLAKLITGIYPTWSGEILFDGTPLLQVPRRLLANSLAAVDQSIFLFEGTILDNLTMWDDTIPLERVIQAAKDAAIHDEIVQRSGSYQHMLEENGRNFSGGQRQRLEMARALVKDPTMLVLDEATSALDPMTEQMIDMSLRRRGCTCIIIAHRLSTIRDADEIIVLERGKVVQRGKHDQLIKHEGLYARLINTEASKKVDRMRNIFDRIDG